MIITVLHPGQMGAAVAAHAVAAGHQVRWVPQGRSAASHRRAADAGLTDTLSLKAALKDSDLVISICPPAAAEVVATVVASHDYRGIYLDANAISPERMSRIAHTISDAIVLDGAIIGPPPTNGRTCRLYTAGDPDAGDLVAEAFAHTPVHMHKVGPKLGAASALKMAFAGFQKSARTLAAVSHALADAHGVRDHLTDVAATMPANILADPDYLPSVAARAWRWRGEMREIAETLHTAHLPADLADATATVLDHWAGDKDQHIPLPALFARLRDNTP
ncbi:DUF1932 domain-containing protein [Streptomyces sp. NPDC003860]